MTQGSEIAGKASFEHIRYAQLWEDADVLCAALPQEPGKTLVSICAAGDNALAMLTLDPARVVVVDLSRAQIACLHLRVGAYRSLSHPEFLELMGSRPSDQRGALLDRAIADLDEETRAFWQARRADVITYGAGGVGKFERYFRIFRTKLLPFVHSKKTIDDIFVPRSKAERQVFLDTRFNTWRWRLLLNLFFSRRVMGRMGRDKAFFDHVEGSVAQHVARRIKHAAVDCDPSQNPYLHWIMTGTHNDALPMPWRAEHYETIRNRLDRLDIRHGALEAFIDDGDKADGFNLSDIFEYMSPDIFSKVYGQILSAAQPKARLVYWNMMAPRRVPPAFDGSITTCTDQENRLKAEDKAFFYSDFVIEEFQG
ncbi:DUF3419 family protein [Yoonia sp. BS5-3]|uniref:DUF3419 family protein n=1 Tax=Yoonia phaeophyticola TaxID=3137369 RepID=A0ABZ2V967_9RHOB